MKLVVVVRGGLEENDWLSSGSLLGLKVNGFDQWRFQCDGKVMEHLQHSYKGTDRSAVSEQGCVLIHLPDHWALHQQGEPLRQQVVSGSEADQQLELPVLSNVPGGGVDSTDIATEWLTGHP